MYTENVGHLALRQSSAPLSLASVATIDRHLCMEGMNVERFIFVVTTAVVSGTPVVVALRQRVSYGNTTGQITVATLTIPGGAVAGAIYYKDVDPIKMLPGQELAMDVTAAATSGAGFAGVKLGHSPESPGNVSGMIASA